MLIDASSLVKSTFVQGQDGFGLHGICMMKRLKDVQTLAELKVSNDLKVCKGRKRALQRLQEGRDPQDSTRALMDHTEVETFPMCRGKAKETLEFTHRIRLTKQQSEKWPPTGCLGPPHEVSDLMRHFLTGSSAATLQNLPPLRKELLQFHILSILIKSYHILSYHIIISYHIKLAISTCITNPRCARSSKVSQRLVCKIIVEPACISNEVIRLVHHVRILEDILFVFMRMVPK